MNKHIVKYLLALATIAFVGGGCNVDDYNEEYLDGFNPDKEITDVQVLKYTMTDADYASVASNAANKAIAEAAGPDAVAALAAVGTAKCFSEAASATTYLPAFLAAGYDSYLSNGSTVTVTYKNATNLAEEVVKLAAAETYTVSGADYQSVWGETPANYFTPEKPLASYAREPWRPGPPFWGPTKTPVDTDAPEPEELLIPLVLPIFITASVFLSMLLILA